MSSEDNLINIADIQAAAKRLDGIAHRTPVLTSTTVNQITNCQVFFKCENFQRTGSFKFRGAYNALSQLSKLQKHKGVLAFSSGNHAQGIALAGKLLDIPTTIVMPENAPAVKQTATHGYGAQVILYNPKQTFREELAQKLAREKDLEIIPHARSYRNNCRAGNNSFRTYSRSWRIRFTISLLWWWWINFRLRDRHEITFTKLSHYRSRTFTRR